MNEVEIVLAREHDREALRRAVRDQKMERIRRGAYRRRQGTTGDRYEVARDRAVARVVAVSTQIRRAVVSHESAALLHGLRLWQPPGHVHVIQSYRASSASARDVARHRLTLADHERTTLGGVPVTSLARTIADCCVSLHPLLALVIVDHALALGLDIERAREIVTGMRDVRGRRRALLVLELADAGAESAWETWLRYLVLRAGLPRPTTQLRVRTPHGEYRADLGWEAFRLLAEFDGRVKYAAGALGPQHDAGRALFDEKRREDHLREERWGVVRVTSSDGAGPALARVLRHVPEEVRAALTPIRLLPAPPGAMGSPRGR
ncbi:Transcriptional regulator, AbiEi antitoxin, Type IV TA system [Promicromonospora umidemergens]|uniref:AbiEi antitoxin of type IV toxin-antitoxin system n=1 Tax=Promicromonospora umidemergens TaxID=629679 RepID=A0ABP8X7E3_9MICO|nr:hypothetical protein [Promicromonospora umidemergens]MCP2281290.1 Transcriptional regulator, AbiEi antitoxin, Type IV TA system [Promicromonospora umidemergens]